MSHSAVLMTAPHAPLVIEEFQSPALEPGAALLRTLYSEVCGTDVHLHHGRLNVPFPIIPGHVSVGIVEASGGKLHDIYGDVIREGDTVTFLDVHETCNNCYQCLVAHQPTRCPSRKVYGITYGAADGLLGGWSEAIWMKPGVKLIKLPEELTPETFIGGGCGLVTALHSVDMAGIRLGESVAVLGVGPVGQSIVAFASLSGAGEVIAVGAPDDRLEFATRMGATSTLSLDVSAADRLEAVRRATGGRGVDVVIEASGAPDAITQGLDMVRDGGRMIVCGHYTDNGAVSIHPHWQINRKHVEIKGCWGSRYDHFHRAVALTACFGGVKPWREMVSGRYTLEQAGDALAAVESQRAIKALITPNPSLVA
ncbi:MAG: Threonine dehydrogenase and related Zn-dependent dehydrogenase [Gemmatimonadetes bacterium]|nr:Threonine dehydrogenase and related Zn-dependent dehydrogenase [Gemmatimonadota bacterium]